MEPQIVMPQLPNQSSQGVSGNPNNPGISLGLGGLGTVTLDFPYLNNLVDTFATTTFPYLSGDSSAGGDTTGSGPSTVPNNQDAIRAGGINGFLAQVGMFIKNNPTTVMLIGGALIFMALSSRGSRR